VRAPGGGAGKATKTGEADALSRAMEEQRERLMPCVHCGFCLPACPTYTRLGDEADSPRGRLHLMRAVVEGRLDPASDAFHTHIDRCLGCRACEPVCPSGVEYGALLELARDVGARHRRPGPATRLLLAVFGGPARQRLFFLGGRVLRATGLARMGAALLPPWGPLRGARLALAMLAATERWEGLDWIRPWEGRLAAGGGESERDPARTPEGGPREGGAPAERPRGGGRRVALLTGCVQEGLYARVNRATVRVLEANGFQVVDAVGQGCCGALHAHGGDLNQARALARRNLEAFDAAGVEQVVVNAAGCGAAMKAYGELLAHDDASDEATALAEVVRDLTELLAEVGPRRGAPVPCALAYDHPCHLLHAQGVETAPLRVLEAVPGVEVRVVEGAEECCGGAGIYGLTHPELGGRIGGDKVRAVRAAGAEAVATPNPGCMMQIGGGLRLEGSGEGVLHPVELLDASYRRAGYYD